MYTKTIVCLANSRKTSGRCIAGKEVDSKSHFGGWIRPVSARDTQEISEEERRYEDGTYPQLLDVIEIPMREALPHAQQSENHLIDDKRYWGTRGRTGWQELQNAVETAGGSLWEIGDSSYYGRNDRISVDSAEKYTTSLIVVRPEKFKIVVAVEGEEFSNPRRKVRADFVWKKNRYVLPVTDPAIEAEYLAKKNGEYKLDEALICVSLGEAHTDGKCYKFCAAVITRRRASK